MTSAEPRPLTAAVQTVASPSAIWAVVSDVRRTGEWSPECRRVIPLGPVRRGGLLIGVNRRGSTRWVTLSRITAFDPGREIAWTVLTNRSGWSYRITPSAGGSTITQTRRTPRGETGFALWFTERFLDGQAGHDDELEAGMRSGLERIASLASVPPGRHDAVSVPQA